MTPESGQEVLERMIRILPDEDRRKIEMARVALREMIKLDPPSVKLAIGLVASELSAEARKRFLGGFPL